MSKKIIIWILVFFAFILGGIYYLIFYRGMDIGQADPDTNIEENTTLTQLTTVHAYSPILSYDQQTVWYFGITGFLNRAALTTSDIDTYQLTGARPVASALWPAKGNDVIVENSSAVQGSLFRLYNASESKFVDLPSNIVSVDWLPDGERIVYLWKRSDNVIEVQTSNSDSSGFVVITTVPNGAKLTASPDGTFVLVAEALNDTQNLVHKINVATGEQQVILDRGRNVDFSIAPNSTQMLFSRTNVGTGLPELWLYNFTDNTFENTGIPTISAKTVWSADSSGFYYALPQNIVSTNRDLVRPTNDTLRFYNMASKSEQVIAAVNQQMFDFRELLLTNDGTTLVFQNGHDSRLWRLRLE